MSSPPPHIRPTTGLTTTPSLRVLAPFPPELRLDIYELVAASDQAAPAPCFHHTCKRASVLSSLSKQIRHESKAAIEQTLRGPCPHSNFKVILSAYADCVHRDPTLGLLEAQMSHGRQHEAKNIDSMHLMTAHLGRNVPLAVIIKFRPFGSSTVAVYGASAQRTSMVEPEIKLALRAMEKHFKSGTITLMRPTKAAGSRNDEIHISDLDAIAEKLRAPFAWILRIGKL